MVLPVDQDYLKAAATCDVSEVEEWINRGANPYATDEGGEVLKAVKKEKAKQEDEEGYLDIVEEHQAKNGTALHLACIYGKHRVIRFLTNAFPTLIETVDSFGNTPILFAIQRETTKFLVPLFLAGAKLNCANRAGWNSFHVLAGEEGKYFYLEAALNTLKKIKGAVAAAVNQQTTESQHTPLCKAILARNKAAVALLKDHTNLKLKDRTGKTVQEKLVAFDSRHALPVVVNKAPDPCCAIL